MKNVVVGVAVSVSMTLSSMVIAESFSDDFEGGFGSSSFFRWGGEAYTDISSDKAYGGSDSLRFRFLGNPDLTEDAWAEKRFTLDKIYDELWIRYKLWVPENYVHRDGDGPDNNKGLIMLWSGEYTGHSASTSLHFGRPLPGQNADGGSMIYGAWRPNSGITGNFYNDSNFVDDYFTPEEVNVGIHPSDRGSWIDWVIHVKASSIPIDVGDISGDGNGKVQVWKNGQLTYNAISANNFYEDKSRNGWDQGYILGWANSGFNEDTFIHIDDFMISTTPEGVDFDLDKPRMGAVFKE